MEEVRPVCPHCRSASRQIRYGTTSAGSQKWLCHACQRVYTPDPKTRTLPKETRYQAVRMYVDGGNFRRIGRLLGVSHQAVINWVNAYHARLKEQHPEPPRPEEATVAELDELYALLRKRGPGRM